MAISDHLCECGCGHPTKVATVTAPRVGHIKGQPYRYYRGHGPDRIGGSIERRFWSKVRQGGADACWLWSGSLTPAGYGQFRKSTDCITSPVKAHRVSYELTYGPIPDGLWVLHRCDVPACVNPSHLFLGTHADNMADMAAKGRSTKGRRRAA